MMSSETTYLCHIDGGTLCTQAASLEYLRELPALHPLPHDLPCY